MDKGPWTGDDRTLGSSAYVRLCAYLVIAIVKALHKRYTLYLGNNNNSVGINYAICGTDGVQQKEAFVLFTLPK